MLTFTSHLPSLQEPILCCKQMWINWEQLRCVEHSHLNVGKTIALLSSLGTCFVQIQSVGVKLACTKRLLNLSAEAVINVHNARLCARCAKFFLKIKQIHFFVVWSGAPGLWRESKINSRCYWKCLLSCKVLFQQRKMRFFWRLCNKSQIPLWLWKVWNLVSCSQSPFYVTGTCKDNKNGQSTLRVC